MVSLESSVTVLYNLSSGTRESRQRSVTPQPLAPATMPSRVSVDNHPVRSHLSVITCTRAFSSVHLKVVSRHWEKPTCTPPCVSEVFPALPWKPFRWWSDWKHGPFSSRFVFLSQEHLCLSSFPLWWTSSKRPPSTSQVSCLTLLSNNAINKPGTILNHTHKELLF